MPEKIRNSNGFYCLRGFLTFVSFFIIAKLTSASTMLISLPTNGKPSAIYGAIPNSLIYLVCSLAAVFIFNSVSLAFATFDKSEATRFLAREDTEISFFKEITDIYSTPRLVLEMTVALALTAIGALLGGFYEIGGIFFEDAHRGGWLPTVILVPICLICSTLSKYEARRYFARLRRENNIEKITDSYGFAIRMTLILIMYPVIFPLAPLMAGAIYSAFTIMLALAKTLTLVGLAVVAVLIPIVFILIPYLKFVTAMRKFLKSVRRVAREEGYALNGVCNAYKYFGRRARTCTFSLTRGEEIYSCLVISALKRRAPLVFDSPNNAYFEYKLGTDKHHVSMNRNVDIFLGGEGCKIIVILPSPKHVFVTDGVHRRRLSQADKIWSYIVHDDKSFIGTMGRGTLYRSSGRED